MLLLFAAFILQPVLGGGHANTMLAFVCDTPNQPGENGYSPSSAENAFMGTGTKYNGPTTLLYSRKAAAFLELVTGVPFVDENGYLAALNVSCHDSTSTTRTTVTSTTVTTTRTSRTSTTFTTATTTTATTTRQDNDDLIPAGTVWAPPAHITPPAARPAGDGNAYDDWNPYRGYGEGEMNYGEGGERGENDDRNWNNGNSALAKKSIYCYGLCESHKLEEVSALLTSMSGAGNTAPNLECRYDHDDMRGYYSGVNAYNQQIQMHPANDEYLYSSTQRYLYTDNCPALAAILNKVDPDTFSVDPLISKVRQGTPLTQATSTSFVDKLELLSTLLENDESPELVGRVHVLETTTALYQQRLEQQEATFQQLLAEQATLFQQKLDEGLAERKRKKVAAAAGVSAGEPSTTTPPPPPYDGNYPSPPTTDCFDGKDADLSLHSCYGHGQCVADASPYDGVFVGCVCDVGYTGVRCEEEISTQATGVGQSTPSTDVAADNAAAAAATAAAVAAAAAAASDLTARYTACLAEDAVSMTASMARCQTYLDQAQAVVTAAAAAAAVAAAAGGDATSASSTDTAGSQTNTSVLTIVAAVGGAIIVLLLVLVVVVVFRRPSVAGAEMQHRSANVIQNPQYAYAPSNTLPQPVNAPHAEHDAEEIEC